MTQTILIAIAAFVANLAALGWAFNEEHYGRGLAKSLARVPCMALTILIPLFTFVYLVEKGLIQ